MLHFRSLGPRRAVIHPQPPLLPGVIVILRSGGFLLHPWALHFPSIRSSSLHTASLVLFACHSLPPTPSTRLMLSITQAPGTMARYIVQFLVAYGVPHSHALFACPESAKCLDPVIIPIYQLQTFRAVSTHPSLKLCLEPGKVEGTGPGAALPGFASLLCHNLAP